MQRLWNHYYPASSTPKAPLAAACTTRRSSGSSSMRKTKAAPARKPADRHCRRSTTPTARFPPTAWWTSTPATSKAYLRDSPACARQCRGAFSGQHHRQPVRQQRHVGGQHAGRSAHPGPVGNLRAPHQVPHHQRGPCARPMCRKKSSPVTRTSPPALPPCRGYTSGQGRLPRRQVPGDQRHPAASARPGLHLQLRRPPALRDRAGARPHRTAPWPRPRRAGGFPEAG